MKNFKVFIALFFLIFALSFLNDQGPNYINNLFAKSIPKLSYKDAWKKVNKHISKSLPKSALKIVNQIYNKAKKEKNNPELIKALIHKINYLQEVEEESLIKIQKTLHEELKTSQYPVKPLLHSMIAEQYWNYYRSNRYRFFQRSATKEFVQDDMRTWDLRKLIEVVFHHYKSSLSDVNELKKTKIDIYDDVLYSRENSRKYRPTLYDFLAHRAIDFFMNSEAGLTKPVYQFTLNDKKYLSSTSNFIGIKIETKEELSFYFNAITYLQDMIKFHLEDKNPEALIDVDLKRIKFVYQKSIIHDKDSIYEDLLKEMIGKYKNKPVATEIYYELAKHYYSIGDKYNPLVGDDYKWHNKKAREICLKAIKKFPGALGSINCQNLINEIESRNLTIKLERTTLPNVPSRGLLHYQNVEEVYFKVIKTTKKEFEKNYKSYDYGKVISFYKKKPSVKEWDVKLPDDGDFQEHSAEVKIASLPQGKYVILLSNSKNFDHSKFAVAYSLFDVSRIAYIQREHPRGLEFHVMDRDSGQPLKNAKVQLWYKEWNTKSRKYNNLKGKLFKCNDEGYFIITKEDSPASYYELEFINNEDHLYPSTSFYSYSYSKSDFSRTRTFFFTDRAIYRPGQTVYFKGIKLEVNSKDGEKSKIIPGSPATVMFYDVNNQKVKELRLKTNEYGTFHGKFKIPAGLINGNMRIADGYGSVYFSVEEYKRPKFEVVFKSTEKSYRVNDDVKVEGLAKAFAGYNIDNAKVKYRVVRKVFYPYRWYFWGYTPLSPQMEILNGVTTTNSKGEFEIDFKAIPDVSVSKKNLPAFRYIIYVDITDLNGETRSSEKSISIGYRSLKLYLNILSEVNKETRNYSFAINSTNLSGEFIKSSGKINIYRLSPPLRIIRKRLWNNPDKFTMKKNEFYKNYPNDLYDDELNINSWGRDKRVFSKKFDTGKSKNVKINKINKWRSGKYLAEMVSKDRFGSVVKEVKYFTLYSAVEKKPPYKLLDWFTILKRTVEPGEKARVIVGSSDRNVRLIYEIEYRGRIISKNYVDINNEQKLVEIPIKEKHRGNFGVIVTFIKHNRVFRHNENIFVPWSNKELKLSFSSFRNKLMPGEKEEWQIKIKGKKSDTVAAEMVATLYDASLDAFKPNSWSFNVFPHHYLEKYWSDNNTYSFVTSRLHGVLKKYSSYRYKRYDSLNWFGFYWHHYYGRRYKRSGKEYIEKSMPENESDEAGDSMSFFNGGKKSEGRKKKNGSPVKANGDRKISDDITGKDEKPDKKDDMDRVKARKNFNETAFFYPTLKTNKSGEVIISFTIPEALTKWKMMGFAHTKKLEYGFLFNEVVTQKNLMVVPNVPRFFRENDTLVLTSKISNISNNKLSGLAVLELFDSATMKPVDFDFNNIKRQKRFSVKKGQSDLMSWEIKIPEDINAVTYRIIANTKKYSDGEEKPVPILKNRMLVTESMPLPVRSLQRKTFKFDKLVNSGKSETLKHHKVTLEFTSNPAWYAVQALPYIMEYPYECMEQTFSRYYANSISSYIVNKKPVIREIFNKWKNLKSSNALLSNLEKNQELKAILLQETPWVMNAKDETERKRRIGLLFDMNRMSKELGRALKQLEQGQMSSGAWPWFNGMRESRYITQHLVTGFARLNALNVLELRKNRRIWKMLLNAIEYLDREIKKDYDYLVNYKYDLKKNHLSNLQIHYLYARSYFQDIPIDDKSKKAFVYFKGQGKKYWTVFNKYSQGMIALTLKRYKDLKTAKAIVASLKEHSISSEEMGMYWKSDYGYYWYQAPIETQALLIEVFHEVTNDEKSIDDMKTWLLKQKQTQDWRTTKATVDACFALLLRGDDWLANNKIAEITVGGTRINPGEMKNSYLEEGTGYFKTSWSGDDIKPEMGNVIVQNRNKVVAWGALYWQYFEQLDKITPHETPLQIEKKLFVERSSSTGPVLYPIEKEKIEIGDRIKVRIQLRVDRKMEYVHMKDMRASGFEPENVISRYKWQDGLGYYESTKDASTNFFIDYLPKGTYVFEYPLRVTHKGDFSNGITTVQCMYAPEFASHSEGIRMEIK